MQQRRILIGSLQIVCIVYDWPGRLLWFWLSTLKPVTRDRDNTVNQSKFEVKTCSRHEAREHVYKRATIAFAFASYNC